MLNHFYCDQGIQNYTFGEQHPLKPERLRRTLVLLQELFDITPQTERQSSEADLLRVHSAEYVDFVRQCSGNQEFWRSPESRRFGFGGLDNPPFSGMHDAALAYVGSTSCAANAVRSGANLAFGIGGGLHHARRAEASGFCIYNDCAVACSILRERFDRVAYVDIDVHHGDGVQWIFYDDPTVLTCSIHEDGRTIYPGTGFTDETGADFSALNVPVPARTSGDVWLDAFRRGILPALERWRPQAIVLQCGTDTHFQDRLGHIRASQGDWLAAVRHVKSLNLPTVVLGGGGYNLTTVPRMWVSAILTMADIPYENQIPEPFATAFGMPTFSDPIGSVERNVGQPEVDRLIDQLKNNHALFA